jgi:hypothetical protein
MPHLDELLGVATVAAAGLLVATAFEPVAIGPAEANARADVHTERPLANSHHEGHLSARGERH